MPTIQSGLPCAFQGLALTDQPSHRGRIAANGKDGTNMKLVKVAGNPPPLGVAWEEFLPDLVLV